MDRGSVSVVRLFVCCRRLTKRLAYLVKWTVHAVGRAGWMTQNCSRGGADSGMALVVLEF